MAGVQKFQQKETTIMVITTAASRIVNIITLYSDVYTKITLD